MKVADREVRINLPRIVVHKMPWDASPTSGSYCEKAGPSRDQAERYASRNPSADEKG